MTVPFRCTPNPKYPTARQPNQCSSGFGSRGAIQRPPPAKMMVIINSSTISIFNILEKSFSKQQKNASCDNKSHPFHTHDISLDANQIIHNCPCFRFRLSPISRSCFDVFVRIFYPSYSPAVRLSRKSLFADNVFGSASHHRVSVDFKHTFHWLLITTGQIPDHRNANFLGHRKDDSISLCQFGSRQEAAQRIIDMLIGTRLVKQQIAISKAPNDRRQAIDKSLCVGNRMKPKSCSSRSAPAAHCRRSKGARTLYGYKGITGQRPSKSQNLRVRQRPFRIPPRRIRYWIQ